MCRLVKNTSRIIYGVNIGFFLFKQKTAYEMRISDWSSDVCSSDLPGASEVDRGIGKKIVRRIIIGVAVPVRLARIAQLVRDFCLAEWLAAVESGAVALARHAKALHRGLILIDEIGEGCDLADRRYDAEVGEDIVARHCDRKSTRLNSS